MKRFVIPWAAAVLGRCLRIYCGNQETMVFIIFKDFHRCLMFFTLASLYFSDLLGIKSIGGDLIQFCFVEGGWGVVANGRRLREHLKMLNFLSKTYVL